MPTLIAVTLASALGGLTRHLVAGLGAATPWPTLFVNLSGSLAAGFVATLVADSGVVPAWVRAAALAGFLGSYTTFSTLSLEAFSMFERGAHGPVSAYVLISVLGGVGAVCAGVTLARAVA